MYIIGRVDERRGESNAGNTDGEQWWALLRRRDD